MYIYNWILFFVVVFILLAIFNMSSGFFAALGLVFGVILVIAIAKRNMDIKNSTKKRFADDMLVIQNVKEGGVIKLSNIDGYDKDLELKVVARNLYMEGDYSWYELECMDNLGEKIWVEVEDDDELVVSVVLKKLNRVDVKPNRPYEDIDEEEAGSVKYDGKVFKYVDSGSAVYYKHCDDAKKEKLYYWDFVYNGKYMVSVEKWDNVEGKPDYLYYYSQIVKPAFITVYSNGGEEK